MSEAKKILLVEDDPFLADIYKTKLKKEGFEIEVIDDGGEVLRKLKENKPDLMVLDIVLPQIDGWAILRKIRKKPELKGLRVIILSNLGEKSDVEKGKELGAEKYLIKARFTPKEVVEEIKNLLKHKNIKTI